MKEKVQSFTVDSQKKQKKEKKEVLVLGCHAQQLKEVARRKVKIKRKSEAQAFLSSL